MGQGPTWTPAQREARLHTRAARPLFTYEDAAWMRDAYVTRGLTLQQIADEIGCSLRTVARWIHIHGIETRKEWARASGPRNGNWTGASICPDCGGKKTGTNATRRCQKCRKRDGDLNPKWRGDAAGYPTVHFRLVAARGKPSAHDCAHCGDQAKEWAYDHTDPNERRDLDARDKSPYSLDLDRYMPLCAPCHRKFDAPSQRNRARRVTTHCRHGHERSPENTVVRNGRPACLPCERAAGRRYQDRKRSVAA